MDLTISSYRSQQPAFKAWQPCRTGVFLSSAADAIVAEEKAVIGQMKNYGTNPITNAKMPVYWNRNNVQIVGKYIKTQFIDLMRKINPRFSMVGNGEKAEDIVVTYGNNGYIDTVPMVEFCSEKGLKGFQALENVANRIATGELKPLELYTTFLERMYRPIEKVSENGRQLTMRSQEQNRIIAKQLVDEVGNEELAAKLEQLENNYVAPKNPYMGAYHDFRSVYPPVN